MNFIAALFIALFGVAKADTVSQPPAPVAVKTVVNTGLSFVMTNTDGSTGNVDITQAVQNTANTASANAINNYGFGSAAKNNTADFVGNTLAGVISALGYTPYNAAANGNGYINATQAAAAAPVQSVNGKVGVVSILASDIATILGYTPYNASANGSGFQTAAQVSAAITAAAIALPGPFTIATLPTCSGTNLGKVAYVTDLGGGADNVVCRGASGSSTGFWSHIRLGTPATNATCGSITLTPLSSAPVQQFTCTSFPAGSSVNIVNSGLYPSEEFYIVTPSSLGGLLSSLGINLNGVATGLTLTAGQKTHYIVTAAGALMQLQ